MNKTDSDNLRIHEDVAFFREALNFTATQTTFIARLIEKDYFCTVVLSHLANALDEVCIFKGGTCLAKVHVGFYRLSEDLDFTIPMPVDAARGERRREAERLKKAFASIPNDRAGLKITEALRGANDSAQYLGTVAYTSTLTGQDETIKVEVALREPLITPLVHAHARTMLLDPLSGKPLVGDIVVPCISKSEAFAEKFRAGAMRRDVAIRDFYDLDHATRNRLIDLVDPQLVDLIRKKLAVPGNDPLNLADARLAELRVQLEPRLRPVLRTQDYDRFDLDRAFAKMVEVIKLLG